MWWKRRKFQGLIAASLYESLPGPEQLELEHALEKSADLRRDAQDLRFTRDSILDDAPVLDVDLLPLLHARLAEQPARPKTSNRLVWAAACLVAMVLGAAIILRADRADPVSPMFDSTSVVEGPHSKLTQALQEADRLVADGDTVRAYRLLQATVKARPADPRIQDAQLLLGDVAFELGEYDVALAAYDAVVSLYYRSGSTNPAQHRVVQRRELLAEAARDNFASLNAVTIAMRDRGNELSGLEQVIADHPGTFVADLAAESMGFVMMDGIDAGDMRTAYLRGMEHAKSRCTSPAAIALLDLKIGDVYRDDFQDFTAAERYYQNAESSDAPVVAKRATDALGSLRAAN